MKTTTKLWLWLAVLVLFSPIGLLLPAYLKAGPAWGEWEKGDIWNAILPDYAFRGWEGRGPGGLSAAYIFSAIAGIAVTTAIVLLIGKFLTRR